MYYKQNVEFLNGKPGGTCSNYPETLNGWGVISNDVKFSGIIFRKNVLKNIPENFSEFSVSLLENT